MSTFTEAEQRLINAAYNKGLQDGIAAYKNVYLNAKLLKFVAEHPGGVEYDTVLAEVTKEMDSEDEYAKAYVVATEKEKAA